VDYLIVLKEEHNYDLAYFIDNLWFQQRFSSFKLRTPSHQLPKPIRAMLSLFQLFLQCQPLSGGRYPFSIFLVYAGGASFSVFTISSLEYPVLCHCCCSWCRSCGSIIPSHSGSFAFPFPNSIPVLFEGTSWILGSLMMMR